MEPTTALKARPTTLRVNEGHVGPVATAPWHGICLINWKRKDTAAPPIPPSTAAVALTEMYFLLISLRRLTSPLGSLNRRVPFHWGRSRVWLNACCGVGSFLGRKKRGPSLGVSSNDCDSPRRRADLVGHRCRETLPKRECSLVFGVRRVLASSAPCGDDHLSVHVMLPQDALASAPKPRQTTRLPVESTRARYVVRTGEPGTSGCPGGADARAAVTRRGGRRLRRRTRAPEPWERTHPPRRSPRR